VGWSLELELCGPAGEAVDFRRSLESHGVAHLRPARVDAGIYETTLSLPRGKPRVVRISAQRPGRALVEGLGSPVPTLLPVVRRVLNLDEDLSPFYTVAAADPELAWVSEGAGRMIRSPTVFEDVVKTICTTNCAWSATVRMVTALVENLGEPAARGQGRAFPTADAMADAPEAFYKDVVRAGYRGAYLRSLATDVASGAVDLEALLDPGLDDEEVERRLLALPGVGPYAAAHVFMLLGRHSRLILDAWTRPTFARLHGRPLSDKAIVRRFRRYRQYAGLAFWLFLTRDWVAEDVAPS
jgi:3-methyladenine DNA glycosylase/8-oxoguanine DNA glycosylase